MKPIRLAVLFDQHILSGGGHQQSLNAALLAEDIPKDLALVLFFTTIKENVNVLAHHGIQAVFINLSLFEKVRSNLRRSIKHKKLFAIIKHLERFTPFEKYFISKQIDLIYFLSPSGWVSDLEKINYITTVWDLCHRDDPEFPEVRLNREFEGREQNYQSILPKAVAVFVDSLMGKENVIRRYGVDRVRTYVMPFQAAIATQNLNELNQKKINISKKYDLDVPYVFYPAQFWAHKNHIYLLEGLHALEKEHNLKVGAIFSGGDQGNITHVKNYVHQLRLEERVRFVGFVKNEEIPDLYCQSIALVMPTYFGPTNLPPLEAFALRVPVLYSDKAGLRDQVGDAALLMDLSDPSSMANHLKALIEDESVRNALINSGTLQLENLNSLDRVGILKIVIEKFRWRRVCWD